MTRTGQGLSYLGGLGIKKQSAFGTAETVDTFGQFLGDSMESDPQYKTNESIFGSPEVIDDIPTIEKVAGGIDIYPFGGKLFGDLLAYALRGSITSAALPYSITATPTVTPAAGAGVADGTYRGAVQAILQETKTGRLFGTNVSPSSDAAVAGTGSNRLNYAWVNPSAGDLANFPGCTHFGTAILRTAPGGAAGTEKYLAVVAGSATTYTDDASATLSAVTPGAAVYWHKGDTSSSVQPPYFTMEVIRDFVSELYDSCMVGEVSTSWKPADLTTAKFSFVGRHCVMQDPSTPSYDTTLKAMPGSTFLGYLAAQGGSLAHASLLEQLDWSLKNNLESVERGRGDETIDEITAGKATCEGSMKVSFKSDAQLTNFKNGQAMHLHASIKAPVVSGGTTTPASTWSFTLSAVDYTLYSFPYMWAIDIPNAIYKKSKQNINTNKRIVQDLGFSARKDASAGYAAQMRWADLCSSHTTGIAAPTVSSVSPANDATGVSVGAAIVWTLSQSLQPGSVNSGSVLVIDEDDQPVSGTIVLANAGASTTITFTPDDPLTAGTVYTPELTPGIRNSNGVALAAPYVSSFTTAA